MEQFYSALAASFQTFALGVAATAIIVGGGVAILIALVVGPGIFGGRAKR